MQQIHTDWKSKELANLFLNGIRAAVPMAREQIELLVRVAKAAVPNASRILDLGCGDGILGRALLEQYPNAQCTFSDFSEHMLEAAKGKCPKDQCEFVLADFGTPDWVEAVRGYSPFDIVVSGFSVHHQPNERKKKIYSEIFGLLRPGGMLLHLEHVKPLSDITSKVFDEVFIDNLCAGVGEGKSREEVVSTYYDRPDKEANALAGLADNCRWLRDVGFVEVDSYFKILELALFGGLKPTESY